MYAIETTRLGLRPFVQEDLEFLVELNADPDVARFIGYGVPRTRAESQQFLDHILESYAEDRLGHLAVFLRSTGALIGRCGLTMLEVEAQSAAGRPPRWFWFRGSAPEGMAITNEVELGYTFARKHWGNGYATESATAMKDFALQELSVPRVVSAIAPGNLASKNVARKLGLAFAGEVIAFDMKFDCHQSAPYDS